MAPERLLQALGCIDKAAPHVHGQAPSCATPRFGTVCLAGVKNKRGLLGRDVRAGEALPGPVELPNFFSLKLLVVPLFDPQPPAREVTMQR